MEARKTSQVDTNMAAGAPSSRSRRGSARSRLHEDKAGKAVRGPASHVDLCEGSRGKEWAQRPDSAVCTFSGVQNKKKSSRARPPPPSPTPPPSLAPLASATLCVSGQISLTVGSAGLCGGLFILEHGLPSGSLHLSKHPPRPLLCVPGLAQPPPLPLPSPSLLPPHLQPAALPHTLFPTLSLLQPTVQSSPLRSLSSPCPVFLLLPGLGFFSRLLLHFHPPTPSSRG